MIPSYRTTIILTRRSKGFRLGNTETPEVLWNHDKIPI
jgi:hypothetical protein